MDTRVIYHLKFAQKCVFQMRKPKRNCGFNNKKQILIIICFLLIISIYSFLKYGNYNIFGGPLNKI